MKEGTVLEERLSADLKYNQVEVKELGERVDIQVVRPGMVFTELMEYRKPIDKSVMTSNIMGTGHLFANLGLSVVLTSNFN